jgi:tRNA pseudouridine55 synthase
VIDLVQPFWKPMDWTSFEVVKKIRLTTGIAKVGHAGTLDPFAEGVLVVCLGLATKRVSEVMELEKEYLATVRLGSVTDTLDRTGRTIAQSHVPDLNPGIIEKVLDQFSGNIQQIPPMYSALKVGGKRLYDLARAGQTIVREPRTVSIYHIALIDWRPPSGFDIQVICSKGTYVRVLALDIARELGTLGYLTALTRTRVGNYSETDSIQMNDLGIWKPITT